MKIILIGPVLKKQNYPLLLLAGFCIALLIVRAKLTHSLFFFFLIWNLFLAWLPLGLSAFIKNKFASHNNNFYFYPLLFCWVMLLPNAPYLITDFIHLQRELAVPVWFDVLLLISFSACGILLGLASMHNIFLLLQKKHGLKFSWFFMFCVSILSGFGIYIGRYLRYNSWDVLHKPFILLSDLYITLSNMAELRAALGITLGFGTLMFLLFHLYHDPEKNL